MNTEMGDPNDAYFTAGAHSVRRAAVSQGGKMPARLRNGGTDLLRSPLISGLLLSLVVAMAIVIVGAGLTRRQVGDKVSAAQTQDLGSLITELRNAPLGLDGMATRNDARGIAGSTDFDLAARKSLSGVDAQRLDVFSVEGDTIFSSSSDASTAPNPIGTAAFEAARRGLAASEISTSSAFGADGQPGSWLTTYRSVSSIDPVTGYEGPTIMVAALTTDVSDDLASAQQSVWLLTGLFAGGMLIVAGVVQWVATRSRKRLEAVNTALAAQNAAVRESRERMISTADATKRAIAEELHGSVQTKLYAAWVRMTEIRNKLPAAAAGLLAEVDDLAAEIDRIREEDIRALSHKLHPSIVRVSASASLRSLARFHENAANIDLHIGRGVTEIEPAGMSQLPEPLRLKLYRIAELALGNVVKHSKATHCVVRFDYDSIADVLTLSVHDDGRGFDMSQVDPSGIGLVTMQDYADALGGQLTITSTPGAGTKVTLVMPFEPAATPPEKMLAADRSAVRSSIVNAAGG